MSNDNTRRRHTLTFIFGVIAAVLLAVTIVVSVYFTSREDDRQTNIVDVTQTEAPR